MLQSPALHRWVLPRLGETSERYRSSSRASAVSRRMTCGRGSSSPKAPAQAAHALGFGLALGSTGVLIVGITTLIAGTLLLSGASAGALIRRSGSAVRATAEAAKRARTALPEPMPDLRLVEPIEKLRPEVHAV